MLKFEGRPLTNSLDVRMSEATPSDGTEANAPTIIPPTIPMVRCDTS